MGTNFYWNNPDNPAQGFITDDWKRAKFLRETIADFVSWPINEGPVSKLKEAYRLTGPLPDPVNVTLPTGVVVSSDTEDEDPRIHIGKRSAAGLYCFDCDNTLCPGGKDRIHTGGNEPWPNKCPKCGQGATNEPLHDSAPGIELGFAEPKVDRPKGVRSCCSFSWAQDPAAVLAACHEGLDRTLVVDEYGRTMTGKEFGEMLVANCPVQFSSLGQWFS